MLDLLAMRPPKPTRIPFPGRQRRQAVQGSQALAQDLAGTLLANQDALRILRHSFASIATDLKSTESTVAALLGHAQGTITSRCIYTVDTALIMAADRRGGLHPSNAQREQVPSYNLRH